MDSLVARPRSQNGHTDSANLKAIKDAFRISIDQGFEAGLEALLKDAHDDCEFRPYIAHDRVLRGHDEIRRYYGEALADGTDMKINPTSFHECSDDEIVVHGSIRIARPTGGFAESQLSWTYRFRDGRLAAAGWGPRQTA